MSQIINTIISTINDIPDYVTELVITGKNSIHLEKGMIPSNIKKITFNNAYNGIYVNNVHYVVLTPGSIPETVEEINFEGGVYFLKDKFEIGTIPFGVKKLEFGTIHNYEHILDPGVLPNSIETLVMQYKFAQPIVSGIIPNSVKYLVIHNNNNLIEGSIPHGVIELELKNNYNKIFPNMFPETIKKLKLSGFDFDISELDKCIPKSVKHLTLEGTCFVRPLVPGNIPDSVEELIVIGYNDSYPVQGTKSNPSKYTLYEGIIPNSVRKLKLICYDDQAITKGHFPDGIESIEFVNCANLELKVNSFPDSVKELSFSNYGKPLILKQGMLPINLKKLTLKCPVTFENDSLPDGLLELLIEKNIKLGKGSIPDSVVELYLTSTMRHMVDKSLFKEGRNIRFGHNNGFTKTYLI